MHCNDESATTEIAVFALFAAVRLFALRFIGPSKTWPLVTSFQASPDGLQRDRLLSNVRKLEIIIIIISMEIGESLATVPTHIKIN